MVRAEYQEKIWRLLDTSSYSTRWPATLINEMLAAVHWREWAGILNVNRYYRYSVITGPLDSNSAFTVGKSVGTGNSTVYPYRIIAVILNNTPYQEDEFANYPFKSGVGKMYIYRLLDGETNKIQLLPPTPNAVMTGDDGIWYNHRPQKVNLLSNDADDVTFPEGYEPILWYETAAMLLSFGGAETNTAFEFQQMAERWRQDMLADVSRKTTNPHRVLFSDRALEWGG